MISVKLMHGLGNQMFQYAFGRALEKHIGQQVLFDLSWYQKAKQWRDAQGESDGCKIRDYELSFFPNLKIDFISNAQSGELSKKNYGKISWFCGKVFHRLKIYPTWGGFSGYYRIPKSFCGFEPEMFRIKNGKDYCYQGFFQNEMYFLDIAEELRRNFSFSNPDDSFNQEWISLIESTPNAVCVHFRLGDYVKAGCMLSESYYAEAIKIIQENVHNPHFFIFGENAHHFADKIFSRFEVLYTCVPETNSIQKKDFRDMQLMSCCRHFIIANSTFSWWSAWLSPHKGKKVIAPIPFLYGKSDIVCKDWFGLKYKHLDIYE